ncbi:MAG TPA: type II asparaginase [Allosphingosinicella sp.]|jgi:L-asparaginase
MKLTRRAVIGGAAALAATGPARAMQAPPPGARRPLPNIAILATGGTIASTAASPTQLTGYRVTAGIESLIAAIPGLAEIANISGEQIANVGSGNITNEHLLKLAARLNALLASEAVDGAVVTHGTDTLEETAYFLNLTVKSDKPVVVVGAMRPASAISADGPLNLYNAVLLAGTREARSKGVMVMLNDRIGAARFVSKTNTTGPDTFKSAEQGYLGAINGGRAYFYSAPLRRHTSASEFDVAGLGALPRVDILYEYQNSGGELYEALASLGARGIVVAGAGNGAMSSVSADAAQAVAKRGIIIARSSRTGSGTVSQSPRGVESGFVTTDSLNPQKARILLMLALTRTTGPARIQDYFNSY